MTILQGTRVKIVDTSNVSARGDIGKTGVVVDKAPLGMVVIKLDDGTEFWAYPHNIAKV